MVCIEGPRAQASAEPRVVKHGTVEPGKVKLGTKTLKEEELVLLSAITFALLGDMLSISFLGLLSLDKPTDFGDADLDTE